MEENNVNVQTAGQYYVPVPKKEKRPGTAKDIRFAAVMAVLGILAVNCLFFGGIGIGFAVCVLGMFIATVIYNGKPEKLGAYALLCGASVVAMCVGVVFSDGSICELILFAFLIFMFDVFFIETRDWRHFKGGTVRSAGDLAYYMFVMTFGKLDEGFAALFSKKAEGENKTRRGMSVLIGLLIAVPVLIIVIPLLISSDAAFEGLVNKLPDIKVGEMIVSVLFGLSIAFLLFTRQFAMKGERPKMSSKSVVKGIDPTVIITALTVISLAYVLYLVSQLAYFFNAFSGLLEEGYTVAQYARRGFFEMTGVCIVNLAVAFFALFFCRSTGEDKKPLGVRLLSLFLCVFSLLLDATAMSKMVLYIKSYGMTRLRIVTSLFMIFLAVVFIAVSVHIFVKKTSYMKIAVAAAAVIVTVTAFTGVERLIADYNVDAYLSGRLSSVDTETIRYLDSYSTVPALVRLAECDNEELASEAKEVLNGKYYTAFAHYNDDGYTISFDTEYDNWRGFRYYEYNGLELLKEKKDVFFDKYYWSGTVVE